jgi:hypothetical protein
MKRLLCVALLAAAAVIPFLGVGCGPKTSKVECKVTLDGTPVEGAQVTFLPADKDGLQAIGLTDSNGVCVVRTGDRDSVRAGKYKVTVTKTKQLTGVDPNESPTQQMEKAMKSNRASSMPGTGAPGGGAGGPRMPGGMMPGAGGGAGNQQGPSGFNRENELPLVYGDAGKTPFEVTVPPSDQPVKLEMKKQ